jgi:hypothetical protein
MADDGFTRRITILPFGDGFFLALHAVADLGGGCLGDSWHNSPTDDRRQQAADHPFKYLPPRGCCAQHSRQVVKAVFLHGNGSPLLTAVERHGSTRGKDA